MLVSRALVLVLKPAAYLLFLFKLDTNIQYNFVIPKVTLKNSKMKGNIFKSVRWMYWLSRTVGQNCYQMPSDRFGGTVRFTTVDSFLCVGHVILMTLLFHSNSVHNMSFQSNRSLVVSYGFQMVLIVSTFLKIYTMFSDIFNRKRIWSILTECYDIDHEVSIFFGDRFHITIK